MLSGSHPFKSKRKNKQQIFAQITDEPVPMLPGFSDAAKDLITKLLKIDPKERLGSSDLDAEEVKSHEFFEKVDWDKIMAKQHSPPYKPCLEDHTDLRNIDQTFTIMDAGENDDDEFASRKHRDSDFAGFSFKKTDLS